MKLKNIIKKLETILENNSNATIINVSREFDSYRGYYNHLAMAESKGRVMSVVSFLNLLYNQLGVTYQGYKGGNYTMSNDTELFVADYGRTGKWVVDVGFDGIHHYLVQAVTDMNGY